MAAKLYGLFRVMTTPNGQRRYLRVAGTGAYPLLNARRIFQDRLIYATSIFGFTTELRPVSAEPTKLPAGEVRCKSCNTSLHTHCDAGSCNCACRTLKMVQVQQ